MALAQICFGYIFYFENMMNIIFGGIDIFFPHYLTDCMVKEKGDKDSTLKDLYWARNMSFLVFAIGLSTFAYLRVIKNNLFKSEEAKEIGKKLLKGSLISSTFIHIIAIYFRGIYPLMDADVSRLFLSEASNGCLVLSPISIIVRLILYYKIDEYFEAKIVKEENKIKSG